MLPHDKNEQLTKVGPGTPMGALLRRHWHPIAAVSELDDNPIKPVRLMGEDLVLYKDLSGNYGLMERYCAHRSADLSYGFVEKCGLRCNYHGWLYDREGLCTEQPFEDLVAPELDYKARIRLVAYRAEAKGGLIWGYMGPERVPLVPTWEPFTWKNGFVQIVTSELPCNWLQCQENSIDPVHFEWMHDNWGLRQRGQEGPYAARHTRLDFEEFEHGFVYKRLREGLDESSVYWAVGRVCLWPHALFTGNHFEWRVPVDDENTLSIAWFFDRVPTDREPYVQKRIPHWNSPIRDEKTGRWLSSHIMNQDFVGWVGQGRITNRSREHLGKSDLGIILMRRRLQEQMEAVAKGETKLKGLVWDAQANACIDLPIGSREELVNGLDRAQFEKLNVNRRNAGLHEFRFLSGQPDSVRDEYREAMGISGGDAPARNAAVGS